jgi:uncharacterized membrane protein
LSLWQWWPLPRCSLTCDYGSHHDGGVLVIAVVVVVVCVFVVTVLLTLNGKEVKVGFKLMPIYNPVFCIIQT